MTGVFLSYRRATAEWLAYTLWQNLTAAGVDVFYDLDGIRAGRFDATIRNEVGARRYMMPILTPGTLERCSDLNDWVRRELETAYTLDRTFVPVYTEGFQLEDVRRFLPAHLGDVLAGSQMVQVTPKHLTHVVADLAANYLT